MEIENDLKIINEKLGEVFKNANLWKFSYSGIYTLEFSLRGDWYGYSFITIDTETKIFVFKIGEVPIEDKVFCIEDLYLIWAQNIKRIEVEDNLALTLYFENDYCCKIDSKLMDPENLSDMRWCIYQKLDAPSFYLIVSDDNEIYLQTP